MPMGVKMKKKTTPITIGLTIIPKINPKIIHNLFKGLRISSFKVAIKKKTTEAIPK